MSGEKYLSLMRSLPGEGTNSVCFVMIPRPETKVKFWFADFILEKSFWESQGSDLTKIKMPFSIQDTITTFKASFLSLFTDRDIQRSHLVLLLHGYKASSKSMDLFKGKLTGKFPDLLIEAPTVNAGNLTKDGISRLGKRVCVTLAIEPGVRKAAGLRILGFIEFWSSSLI